MAAQVSFSRWLARQLSRVEIVLMCVRDNDVAHFQTEIRFPTACQENDVAIRQKGSAFRAYEIAKPTAALFYIIPEPIPISLEMFINNHDRAWKRGHYQSRSAQ